MQSTSKIGKNVWGKGSILQSLGMYSCKGMYQSSDKKNAHLIMFISGTLEFILAHRARCALASCRICLHWPLSSLSLSEDLNTVAPLRGRCMHANPSLPRDL